MKIKNLVQKVRRIIDSSKEAHCYDHNPLIPWDIEADYGWLKGGFKSALRGACVGYLTGVILNNVFGIDRISDTAAPNTIEELLAVVGGVMDLAQFEARAIYYLAKSIIKDYQESKNLDL